MATEKVNQSGAREVSAREVLDIMFIETGALVSSVRPRFEASGAEIWSDWSSDPNFLQIDSEKRESIRRYLLVEYPQEAATEVLNNSSRVFDDYAPRLDALFDAEALNDVRVFLQTEGGRSYFVRANVSQEGVTPSANEMAELERFSRTAGGAVWRTPEFGQFLEDVGSAVASSRAESIRNRLIARTCELLDEQRTQLNLCSP